MGTNVRVVRRQTSKVRSGLKLRFDYWLVLAVAALLVVGFLMVFSTTFDDGILIFQDPIFYLKRQFQGLGLGILAILVLMQFDYPALRRYSIPLLGLTLAMLAFLLFFGEATFGSARAISSSGSYQPSEIAKLTTILYIAHWLSTKGDKIRDMTYGLLPFATIVGVVCFFIVAQPDLSTAGLVALTCLTLFFVAGAELKQLLLAGGAAGGTFVLLMMTLPYAQTRVNDYLVALRDPIEGSYQLRQVLIALGSGQWFGVGLGEGTQKFGPLPAAHTDGVFAILGEELGFVGCLVVIGLYAFFCWRGMRIAMKARDSFGFLLALGITCWLTYQALMNIAVITAVMPFTGIPLPFLSYGGSSLAASLTGVGILLNISRDAALTRNVQTPRRSGKTAAETVRERFDLWRRDGRSHLSRPRRNK